ncbi:MAG: hypothetical protein U0X73_15040 [Thermoanaerobaculia bacterium]
MVMFSASIEFAGLCGYVPNKSWKATNNQTDPSEVEVFLPKADDKIEVAGQPVLPAHSPVLLIRAGCLAQAAALPPLSVLVISLMRRIVEVQSPGAASLSCEGTSTPATDYDFHWALHGGDVNKNRFSRIHALCRDNVQNSALVAARIKLKAGKLRTLRLHKCSYWFVPGSAAFPSSLERRSFAHRSELLLEHLTSLKLKIGSLDSGKPLFDLTLVPYQGECTATIGNLCADELQSRIGMTKEQDLPIGSQDQDLRRLYRLAEPNLSDIDLLTLPAPVYAEEKGACGGIQKPRCFSLVFEG